jgi:hypothetical protein
MGGAQKPRGAFFAHAVVEEDPMRKVTALVTLVGAAAAASTFGIERDAAACGGCFHPPPPPHEIESVITDERMMLAVTPEQTTLYDEIRYSGSPKSFAWVLPIHGVVTVGLSADVMFATIDQLTATQVVQPPANCPPPPSCNNFGTTAPVANFSGGAAADAGAADAATVTVTAQAQVGPYEMVQLASTDGSALTNWLVSHGYQISSADKPVVDAYVAQGFNFLALKLIPGADVHAMQPVRVTSKGASVSLPLHMVAVGTGPVTGISIWVVADGRWEPQNFPTFTITDSELAWDWNTSSSNYETLRVQIEAAFGGRGWQIESSLELAKYTIQNALDGTVQNDFYSHAVDYPAPPLADGGTDAGAGDAGDDGGVEQQNAADDDLKVLFQGIGGGNVRITRMRSDVAHTALSADMFLQAAKDQSEMTNIHNTTKEIGQPLCPVYDNNCAVTGEAPRDQAIADANARGAGCNATRSRSVSDWTLMVLGGVFGVSAMSKRLRRKNRKS